MDTPEDREAHEKLMQEMRDTRHEDRYRIHPDYIKDAGRIIKT